MEVFSSTIIPTVNRPSLRDAVCSVLDQDFHRADFEVIVVNDSGQPLPGEHWQRSPRVRVIATNRRERSIARNTGAAIARGKYLHFLDDDDLFLPGALEAFWHLDQTKEDAWLYGSYQAVDNDGKLVSEYRPQITGNVFAFLVAGEAIPFQASLLRNEQFQAAGGYDPKMVGTEDRDLGRQMALSFTVAYTPTVVARIRIGPVGSTTNWATLAESDRRGREKALNSRRAFARLWASAATGYWHGRVSRAYLASVIWNLKRGSILTAASRATAALAFAARHPLSPEFWQGLRTKIR